jgi:broad specificity phosphatase PhoE
LTGTPCRLTTVWLARHGEVHNPSELLYGRLPRMGLSPEGQRQARELADFLTPRPLAAIYTSPLLRARRTAAAILERHPELGRVRSASDLIEVRTSWEGQPLRDLENIGWDFYSHPRHPEDESLEAICNRMQRWLNRMLRRHAGSEVVGVSHGDPVLILVGAVQGVPLEPKVLFPQPYIEPGTVYRMRFNADGNVRDVDRYVPHAQAAA